MRKSYTKEDLEEIKRTAQPDVSPQASAIVEKIRSLRDDLLVLDTDATLYTWIQEIAGSQAISLARELVWLTSLVLTSPHWDLEEGHVDGG